MTVDNDLLKKLEKLSFIEINANEREEIMNDIENILSFVENISDIGTDSEDSKFTMKQTSTTLRKDLPIDIDNISNEILSHAFKTSKHSFLIPKIIE